MSDLQYFDYEGFGDRSKKDLNYSQTVRIDNRIETSGQGGWDRITEKIPSDLGEEIHQAFDNVDHALKQAGGKGWEQVYKVRIYLVLKPEEKGMLPLLPIVAKELKSWCKNHGPLMTAVEVAGLYDVMRIEIEAEAHLR